MSEVEIIMKSWLFYEEILVEFLKGYKKMKY